MSLVDRVRSRIAALGRRVLDAVVAEVPLYAQLPKEQLEGEILTICRHNIEVFLDSLERGGEPAPEPLAELRASASRRAEERIPLEAVLAAYHVGGRVVWEELEREATTEERTELMALARPLMIYVQTVTSAVADSYLEEMGSISGEEREARRALADGLLVGADISAVAQRLGERVASAYVVVVVRLGRSADEQDAEASGDVTTGVAGRRKVRRIEQRLAARGDGTLHRLDAQGGVVLLPVGEDGPDERSTTTARLAVDDMADAGGAPVTAGLAVRTVDAVPSGVVEARELLDLVLTLGHPPGAYALDDLVVEYQLTRPTSASGRLAELLAPLEEGPDLIPTLEAWFAEDFDRRQAAAALHVHPNTLDYRLRRVASLTGYDVTSARGLQVLGAALLVRRVQAGRPVTAHNGVPSISA